MVMSIVRRGGGIFAGVVVDPLKIQATQTATRRGLNTRQTQEALRAKGIGYRRQAMLEVIAETRGAMIKGRALADQPASMRVPVEYIQQSKIKFATKYLVKGTFQVVNTRTGESNPKPFQYGTNQLGTFGEVKYEGFLIGERAAETGQQTGSEGDLRVVGVPTVEVWQGAR